MATIKNFILRLDLFREPGKPPSRSPLGAPTVRFQILGLLTIILLLISFMLFTPVSGSSVGFTLGIVVGLFLKLVAELLSRDRRILAGVLRLGSGVAFALGFVVLVYFADAVR